jgi:hypothetical protein
VYAPFHVVLEYERNRLTVVAEQKKRFREVRDVVTTKQSELRRDIDTLQLRKRHASIQADEFLSRISDETDHFLKQLDDLEQAQPDVFDRDEIRDRIERLLVGHIGEPPTTQKELDEIFSAGVMRYQRFTPPGYLDSSKAGAGDEYEYGGLIYRRQFGDLVVWNEIIGIAKKSNIKNVILVTDDEKEDWWWIVESQGRRRLGPRPELVEEIQRRGDVERFHMYNSEQLVKWSGEYLKVTVQSESADQIREIKDATRLRAAYMEIVREAEVAVALWVRSQHPDAVLEGRAFPDVIANTKEGRRVGYEILMFRDRSLSLVRMRIREVMRRSYYEINQQHLDELWLVFPDLDITHADWIVRTVREREGASLSDRLGVILGLLTSDLDDTALRFTPVRIVPPETPAV